MAEGERIRHLETAHYEYLPKYRAQGQGTNTSQSICVQIFVVKCFVYFVYLLKCYQLSMAFGYFACFRQL